jgi:CubicO group peptidase (beta-lactamase class C family)
VTVAHLLSHTAGLPATWDGWRRQVQAASSGPARWRERAREDVVADILAVELVRPPGRDFEYSCLGYITAMAVAERATGCAWDTLVTDHLLRPLGLGQTIFRPDGRCTAPTERQPELGRPLVHGVVHDETAYALGGVSGNAGLFAPIADVLRLGRALLDGVTEVLPAEMAVRLWEDQLPELLGAAGAARVRQREGFGHSLGLRIGQAGFMGKCAGAVRGHTGFTGTSLVADRERRAAVVLLTNRVHPRRDGPDLMPVRAAVADALRASRPLV